MLCVIPMVTTHIDRVCSIYKKKKNVRNEPNFIN